MKYRRFFILILSVLMMLPVVQHGFQHVQAETEINRVTLMGVKAPIAGQKATTRGIYVPGTGVGYHIDTAVTNSLVWYNDTDDVYLQEGDVFKKNKIYQLHARFAPDSGYSFALVQQMICQLPDMSYIYECEMGSYGSQQSKRIAVITFKTALEAYNVEFNSGGGIGEMEPVTVYYGEKYLLPDNEFMAPGPHMMFDGWDLGKPGTQITVDRDTVVTARWKVRDGYTGIRKVEIICGVLPTLGEKIVTDGWKSADESQYNVISDLVMWKNVTDNEYPEKGETFKPGKRYEVSMTVDCADMYYFPSSPMPSISIKGYDSSVYTASGEVRSYQQSMIVTFTFNPLPSYDLLRIYGDNRFGTSMAIADSYRNKRSVSKLNSVILACSDNFADALAGSYLSAVKDAPIVIINDSRSADVEKYLKDKLVSGGQVYILGGEKAVSVRIENDMKGLGFKVSRLAGSNRYGTNMAILKEAGGTPKYILVATGTNFADSLSASASGQPILLVGNTVTDEQIDYVRKNNTAELVILGGVNAVSLDIEDKLNHYIPTTRISGFNRYETSEYIAQFFFNVTEMVVVANGDSFPDGLCAGPLGYLHKAPLLLVKDGQSGPANLFVMNRGIRQGIAAGGTAVVSDKLFKGIFNLDSTAVIRELKK